MTRSRTWMTSLVRLAVVGALAGLMPGIAWAEAPAVPTALQVPDGQSLLFRAYAVGTQNYACMASASGTTIWTFRQPKAVLLSEDGEQLGIHGRGPLWVGYDGSRVVGSSPVSAASANPAEDVPLLLLRATPGETEGRFAGVSYIHRLDTRGGVAPEGACDPTQQASLAVPYMAVYYFYGPLSASSAQE
jgi:hypothetical protein